MLMLMSSKKACVKKRVCSLKPVSKENSPKSSQKMTQTKNKKKNREKKIHVSVVEEEEEDR